MLISKEQVYTCNNVKECSVVKSFIKYVNSCSASRKISVFL